MCRPTNAIFWAFAIILLAAANAAGFVADDSADVLFIVLPIIAWLSISGRTTCLRRASQ